MVIYGQISTLAKSQSVCLTPWVSTPDSTGIDSDYFGIKSHYEHLETGQTYSLVTVFFQCCGFNSTCAYLCGSQLEIFKQTVHAEAVCASSQPLRGTISMGGYGLSSVSPRSKFVTQGV